MNELGGKKMGIQFVVLLGAGLGCFFSNSGQGGKDMRMKLGKNTTGKGLSPVPPC